MVFLPDWRPAPWGLGLIGPMKRFYSNRAGFSIIYPASWIATEFSSYKDPDTIAEIVNVGFLNMSKRLVVSQTPFITGNIKDIVVWKLSKLNQLPGFFPGSLSEFSSKNYQGYRLLYRWNYLSPVWGVMPIKCMDWYLIQHKQGYILSFCIELDHWDEIQPVFNEMIDSFLLY
jgi:hypothetical protein